MAIISSTAIGAGRKTAGELTYRHTRGRTIASRRITANKSNTRKQKEQRSAFGEVAAIAKSLAPWIELAFPKTKYGSQRNNFVKSNPALMQQIKRQADIIDEYYTPVGFLAEALERGKDYGVQITAGKGNGSLNYIVNQTPEGLTYNLTTSRRIEANDTVRVLIALSYITEDFEEQFFETVNVYEYAVTPEKAQDLTDPYHITITAEEIPQLADLSLILPPASTLCHLVTSASIEQEGKAVNTTLQTFSYIFPVPAHVISQELDQPNKQAILKLSFQDDRQKHLHSGLIGAKIPAIDYYVKSLNIEGDLPTGIIIAPQNETLVPVTIEEDEIVENAFVITNGLKTLELLNLKVMSHGI